MREKTNDDDSDRTFRMALNYYCQLVPCLRRVLADSTCKSWSTQTIYNRFGSNISAFAGVLRVNHLLPPAN